LGANAGDGFNSIQDRIKFKGELNELFRLDSDEPFPRHKKLTLRTLNPRIVFLLRFLRRILEIFSTSIIIQVESTLSWVDRNTWSYEHPISKLHESLINPRSEDERLIVDLHLRRAGIPTLDPEGRSYARWTPTHWYEHILSELAQLCALGDVKMLIRVHTDSLNPGTVWKPPIDISPQTIELWENIGVLTQAGELKGESEDFCSVFSAYGEVEIMRDIDTISVWKSMIQSDVLLIAKSSMSYVAGLFRYQKPVFFTGFWHSGLVNWIEVEPDEMISQGTQIRIREAGARALAQMKASN
jgi:hypothetical protein